MRSVKQQLMTLLRVLRQPHEKPADIDTLDRRLDAVDRRLEHEKRRRILQDRVDTVRHTGA